MIFLLLIVTKVAASANKDADLYAIQINKYDYHIYVYTRVRNCAVYESNGKLFFQEDGIWKIGNLKTQVIDEIDCKNISSFVEQPYQPFREPFIKIFISNLINEGTITLFYIIRTFR